MNDSLTQNSQQNFNRSHFKYGKKKNSSLVIERMPQSLTPGVISVCFLPGSEDRTPGGSVVTNLDNLKSSFTPVAAEVGRNLVNSTESKIVS